MAESSGKVAEHEVAAPVGPAPEAPASAGPALLSPALFQAVAGYHTGVRALPRSLLPGDVLDLQRSAGNHAVNQLMLSRRGGGGVMLARQPAAAPATAPPGRANPTPGTGPAAPVIESVDWEAFWKGDTPNAIRTGLEVLRLYPGWGLLAGGAADLMNAKQDFEAIKGEDAPEIETFLMVRSSVMIANNAVGHIAMVNQLIQDIAAGSVVGAELVPVTATANEILLSVKVGLDGAQFLLDFGLTCGAKYRSMTAPPGSDSQQRWDTMIANYEANLLGDLVGGIFDVIDLSTAGVSNAQPIKQGAKAVKSIFSVSKHLKGLIKPLLQSWFGVWGGKAFERGPDGQGGISREMERQAASLMLVQLHSMKASYVLGDVLIGAAADHIAKQMTELNQAATLAIGGRDPFITARDGAVKGLEQVAKRVGDLAEMGVMASTAKEKSASVTEFTTDVLALLDRFVVPEVKFPEADIGDDAVSEAAEGLLNMGGKVIAAGPQLLVDELNEQVDTVKDMLRPPIEEVRSKATEVGDFFQIVTDEAKAQAAIAKKKVEDFSAKLAKCNSFEDVVNVIVNQIFEMIGLEADFEVDDIRKAWAELGPLIDGGIVWAEGLIAGRPTKPPHVDAEHGTGPVHASAGDAEDPTEGAGAGNGAAAGAAGAAAAQNGAGAAAAGGAAGAATQSGAGAAAAPPGGEDRRRRPRP